VTVVSGYRDQDRLIVIAGLGEAGDKIKASPTPAAMGSFMSQAPAHTDDHRNGRPNAPGIRAAVGDVELHQHAMGPRTSLKPPPLSIEKFVTSFCYESGHEPGLPSFDIPKISNENPSV
jgi:hypothetical protein